MANSRQKKTGTATILAILLIAFLVWLPARRGWESDPTPRPTATESAPARGPAAIVGPANATTSASGDTIEPARDAEHSSAAPALAAMLDVRIRFAEPNGPRTVRVVARRAHDLVRIARDERDARDTEHVARLELPPDRWIRVEAIVDSAHLPTRRVRLGAGERAELRFECAGQPTRLRVRGPSRRLAAHLELSIVDLGGQTPTRFELPLRDDGTAACYVAGPFRAGVPVDGGRRVMLLDPAGRRDLAPSPDVLELAPAEPVIGLLARRRGEPVAAAIAFAELRDGAAERLCTITTRAAASAAETVFVHAAQLGHRRGPTAQLDREGDLWSVDVDALCGLGRLQVELEETRLITRVPDLVAVPRTGGEPVALGRDRAALLPAGDYRVAWAPHGLPAETAADFVRITPGETSAVTVAPLALQRWTVVLPDAPPGLALSLRFANVDSRRPSTDGRFQIELGRAPRAGEAATVVAIMHQTAFSAEFVATDPASRSAEIRSALADAVWTTLEAVPLQSGPTGITLFEAPAGRRTEALRSGARLPMPPGATRRGCVIDEVDGQKQLTRWFELEARADAATVTVEARGRWATLTLARQVPVRLLCAGPNGELARVQVDPRAGSAPFFVADGTTAIHADAPPLDRQSFDAKLSEFVVR